MSKLEYPENVISSIFGESSVKNMVELIFDKSEESIKKRFDEIMAFIVREKNDAYSEIQYDEIKALFKKEFLEEILDEALNNSLTDEKKVTVNVLKLLNDERLKKSIFGKTMVRVFQERISKISTGGAFAKALRGSTIYLLEREFVTE